MRLLDFGVILLYLVGITWFGTRFRRSQKGLKDYFLGGRSAPWWAIGLSIVSAETSTLTIIGTPTMAFGGNFCFLQVVFGYLLGRIVISYLLLPHYFRGELYTAYELMQIRFGGRIRKLTAGTFLVIRALAEGVRVFAISIVISIVLGTGEIVSIFLIVGLTLLYTFEGGMTAVIWTDVVQMFLYVCGAVVSLWVILHQVPGGWAHVSAVAEAAGKFQVFDTHFNLTREFFSQPYNIWAGLIGGCFAATASHGTEQLMVQRLLAARSEKASRMALLGSWLVILTLFTLFLVIGAILYVHYQDLGLPAPQPADRLYPEFVWNSLPPIVSGLVIAAILAAAMSNLSAALNSLASTTVMDFYRPLRGETGRSADGSHLKLARWITIVWGVVLLAIGTVARHWGPVLEAGLTIASIAYGGLLGVFLLGIGTRRVKEGAATAGMIAGLGIMIFVKFGTHVAWTWYVPIGTITTFCVGLLASWIPARRPQT